MENLNNNQKKERAAGFVRSMFSKQPTQDYKPHKSIISWFIKVLIVTALLTIMISILLRQDRFYNNYINPDTKAKIDSLSRIIEKQESNISGYKTQILNLQNYNQQLEIEKQDNYDKINKIKKEYEKKHAAVDNYDVSSLDSFFQNRYQ